MIYLDSSALLKLVHQERESDALELWLAQHATIPLVSSQLAKVEVIRATRRINPDALLEATSLLDSLDLIPISANVVDRASMIGQSELRSLDAIHLASATAIHADLTAFVAYDARLAEAATDAGFGTKKPGA